MNKILFFICLVLLFGCDRNRTQEECMIDTQTIKVHTGDIKLSDIVQIRNIVPLETTDKSLIGKIDKLLKTGDRFFIKSSGIRILCFDNNGKYLNDIGGLGSGPQEYPVLYDFDADSQNVFVLTEGRILVYDYEGSLVREIPISVNAVALKAIHDEFLLYTLGDKYVYYRVNSEGKIMDEYMEKSQALRLTKSAPFKCYKHYCLSALGRSNEVMVYNRSDKDFFITHLTNLPNALTLEKENEVKASSGMKSSRLKSQGILFDGLNMTENQLMFGSIEGDEITLWSKTVKGDSGHLLSKIEDDIAYIGIQYWLKENAVSPESFVTFVSPDYVVEGIKKHSSQSMESNDCSLKALVDTIHAEEANPIIFEFDLK